MFLPWCFAGQVIKRPAFFSALFLWARRNGVDRGPMGSPLLIRAKSSFSPSSNLYRRPYFVAQFFFVSLTPPPFAVGLWNPCTVPQMMARGTAYFLFFSWLVLFLIFFLDDQIVRLCPGGGERERELVWPWVVRPRMRRHMSYRGGNWREDGLFYFLINCLPTVYQLFINCFRPYFCLKMVHQKSGRYRGYVPVVRGVCVDGMLFLVMWWFWFRSFSPNVARLLLLLLLLLLILAVL